MLHRANGEKYKGMWKDDDRTGEGTFVWSNGDVYEGEWKDSSQHGQGKLVWYARILNTR
jgi:hypothetical protein